MNMDKLFDVNLLRELQKDNLWWTESKIPLAFDRPFYRADFYKYINYLESKDIQVIIGPRRVGKTILLHQLIKYLIDVRKVNPKYVIYLDLSKPYIAFDIGGILPSLKIFQESILQKDFTQLGKEERIYIFVDEVQKEKEWAANLESIRSRSLPVTFFVTGSSGTEIDKRASESLVGRANYRYILPLKFRDIVRKELGYNQQKLIEIKELPKIFENAIKNQDINLLYNYVVKELFPNTLTSDFEIKIKNILMDYLLKGGYPEFYDEYKDVQWYAMAKRMRDDYFERIISRDIVETFKVSKPDILRKLYLLISFDTGNIANFANYAGLLGTRKNTVTDYFEYLQRSFLINSSSRFFGKKRPRGEQKKVYVLDIGMRNAVLGLTKKEIAEGPQLGLLAETVVHSHCKRLQYRLHPTNDFSLGYWKDKDKKEIDIIFDLGYAVVPLEVKYVENIRAEDKETLQKFIASHKKKTKFGILITKNEFHLENNIIAIPLWLFLLIC